MLMAAGLVFLAYYLVVRLTLMEQIVGRLEQAGVHTLRDIAANLSGYLIAYLLWVYSFRLGMLLWLIGAALTCGVDKRKVAWLVAGGAAYLATCYLPIVGYSPPYYGILGVAILVLFLLIVWYWKQRRPTLPRAVQVAGDLRMLGYYFVLMGTWTLCGIFGVVTYALKPEVMLERELQSTALNLTGHVMLDFTLGWLFLFLSARRESAMTRMGPPGPASAQQQ